MEPEPSKTNSFPPLTLTRPPTLTASADELASVDLRSGFQLPASYRDFAKTFGYGLLCNLFLIYIPMGNEDSLPKRSAGMTKVNLDSVENDWFYYKPDGSPELVRRLIPFGTSENGNFLAWDPAEPTGANEYAIYLLGARAYGVQRAASDLYEFIKILLDEHRGRALLGNAYTVIRPTFKPIEPYYD